MPYSFCPKCGQPLNTRLIDGQEQLVCSSCGFVFYQNSKPCSSALTLNQQGRLLLVQRAIEPYKNYWDIPGGFLEPGEDPETGAIREMEEETGLQIKLVELLGIFMDTYNSSEEHTLNLCYVAEVVGGQARAASDATQLQWFDLQALPEKIAFDWSKQALEILQEKYGRP